MCYANAMAGLAAAAVSAAVGGNFPPPTCLSLYLQLRLACTGVLKAELPGHADSPSKAQPTGNPNMNQSMG